MAKTINDAHLSLAYRLGESGVPSDATELARRMDWFKEAINDVCSANRPYWFMEADASAVLVADDSTYSLASDFRKMVELKVTRYKYHEIPYKEVYEKYELPSSPVPILSSDMEYAYYYWNGKITIIPTPSSASTAVTVTITSSGTTCTVTSTAHGLYTGDFVTIAGAVQTAYNGTFEITKTSADAYTYTAASTPSATPATGTITSTWNDIAYKYYKNATEPTTTASSIIVPDQYINLLASYAEGRYWLYAQKRGRASDAFTEYDTILRKLNEENERRNFYAE